MKRLILPVVALILVVFTVAQVKAMRQTGKTATATAAIPSRVIAEGRVVTYPGSEVTVGTDVGGTVEMLEVAERDVVKRGDVIARIKADDTRAALAEARARVGEAEADIRLFEAESSRARQLWREEVGSKQAWDRSERDLDAARARRASAVAEVRRLEAVLAKNVIVAPIDGVVIERFTHRGETIAVGDPLLTIADLKKTRIEAEIDEFDAARVTNGGTATIKAEGFDGQEWRGTIEEIPDAVTSRRLKPQDTSKPTDTRVLLVKIAMNESMPLKLGQRVEVTITH